MKLGTAVLGEAAERASSPNVNKNMFTIISSFCSLSAVELKYCKNISVLVFYLQSELF